MDVGPDFHCSWPIASPRRPYTQWFVLTPGPFGPDARRRPHSKRFAPVLRQVDSYVKPLHSFPASSVDPSPAYSRSVVLSTDGQNQNQRLRLPDGGGWVLLRQTNDGGVVVLQSGREGSDAY